MNKLQNEGTTGDDALEKDSRKRSRRDKSRGRVQQA